MSSFYSNSEELGYHQKVSVVNNKLSSVKDLFYDVDRSLFGSSYSRLFLQSVTPHVKGNRRTPATFGHRVITSEVKSATIWAPKRWRPPWFLQRRKWLTTTSWSPSRSGIEQQLLQIISSLPTSPKSLSSLHPESLSIWEKRWMFPIQRNILVTT